jgi:serine/threonine protein kinase/curved DNA-binding protein CbpA
VAQGAEACLSCGRHLTTLTKGTVIAARYEVQSLLGKGGMGIVYQAHDRLLDEVVAIKVLRGEFVQDPAMAARFRSEIKLARKVSHPNVCRIHEYGEDGPISYISMALIEGTDLRRVLRQHPEGLAREAAFRMSLQASEGLRAIHDVGIIHRDLKSPNIVCDPAGTLKLMDFGIAKESGLTGGLTAAGEVMGTPEYMSPEQCRGTPLDFRSDIYSLGIVIYEIFTGRVPFQGDSVMVTLLKQVEAPPPLDGPAAARIPAGVVAILRKALAKSPAERFTTVAEVVAALRAAEIEDQKHQKVVEEAGPTIVIDRMLERVADRRRDSRLPISLELMLRRLGAGGSVLQEERTVTDNLGAHGARVLTTMNDLAEGHTVSVQEVGGSFATRSVIRHISTGPGKIRRLGVEFVDRNAPDHLVPSVDSGGLRVPAGAAAKQDERRKHSRLSISVEVILRRLSPGGAVLREERTVVDNIGRRGARVLTTMTDLADGDIVSIQEVGSEFKTNAAVRSVYTGPDHVRRIGLEFLDRTAPEHLVPPGDDAPRTAPRTAPPRKRDPPAPVPKAPEGPRTAEEVRALREEIVAAHGAQKAQTHFEVLGLPRASGAAQVKEAYLRLSRRFHPDALREPALSDLMRQAEGVFSRITDAYKVLIDPDGRSRYEEMLGPSRRTPPTVQRAPQAPTPAASVPPPAKQASSAPSGGQAAFTRDKDAPPSASVDSGVATSTRLAGQILEDAQRLIAGEKYWDAIQALEGAVQFAPGTKTNQSLRILLAQTKGRNPKWLKDAESSLLEILKEDPRCTEACLALAGVYKAAGLKGRAVAQLRKALELEPGHARAQAEMDALQAGR